MPVTLIEIASVLVIERRICRCCGTYFDAPSPNLHVLAVSPLGHSPARAIQRVPNRDLEATLAAATLRRTTFLKEVEIPNCYMCWEEDVAFAQLESEPAPPAPVYHSTQPALRVVSEPRLEDL